MSVVGLDVGNLSCYVAVAAGGGIETIANEYSDRCTPAFVSLSERSRCMGVSAKNQSTTNLKNTLSCFKRFLGRSFTDPQVQDEMNSYIKPFSVVKSKDGGTLIQAQYLGERQEFTPEQVMAMLLTKLKETGELAMKTKVVDTVVSVPCFFTDIERRAMMAACQIAGLNCLKVMNDTTAVALAYGIYKQDLPPENEKARNVIFVDMGYCSLQVSLVSFNKGKLKVLATASESKLGGRDFDKLLVDYFINEWRTKYKIDVLSKPKAIIRLAQECEKLKKNMSANSTKIPINIECFVDDKDVTGHMDRATFEGMSERLFQKAEAVFNGLLTASKVNLAEVYSVELVGGSSRIPALKELVSKVFQKEPSTTLNADEAVSRGCALQCAILSPTFRVRDFSIQDCQAYPISLSWQGAGLEDDPSSSMEVFPEFHAIPFSKMLTFYRKSDFTLEASYSHPEEVPIQDPYLGLYKITKVLPQASGESSKVKVKVRVNNHGIFSVTSASMVEKIEKEETANETMDVDQKENDKDAAPQSPESQKNAEAGSEPMDTDQTPDATKEETKDEQDAKDEKKDKDGDKKEKKKKSTVRSIDLPVETTVQTFGKDLVHSLLEKENAMIMQDRLERERLDAKNAVEEYVYDMRDKLCGQLEEFSREEDRERFSKLLGETEDWLYDEGDDQKKQIYIDKLAELKKQGDPITNRFREAIDRPRAFEDLGASLQRVRKFLDLYEAKDEKYIHIEQSDVDKVKKLLKEKSEWFDKQMSAQGKLKKYDNPTVLASQIFQTRQSLESFCSPIMNKSKPKPKEEPPKEEKKDDKEAKKEEKMDEETKNGAGGDAQKPAEPTPETTPSVGDMDVD